MAILNYSTSIDVNKTISEIQKILIEHKAMAILNEYDNEGNINALSFKVTTENGIRAIKLPSKVEPVLKILKEQKRQGKIRAKVDYEQANRVAWRIIKNWIEAQMAILETDMVKIEQIFLPYIVNSQGKTLYELFNQNSSLMLGE